MFNRFKQKNGDSKYKNKKVEYDGILFDSKKEKDRYVFLKEAERNGEIKFLRRQMKFELIPSIKEEYEVQLKTKTKTKERTVQLPITYTCDFAYIKDGKEVIEDVKSSPKMAALDKTFLIKEKLFRWKFGFSIRRVYKHNEQI